MVIDPLTISDLPGLMVKLPPFWMIRSWQNVELVVVITGLFGVSEIVTSLNEVGTFEGLQLPAFFQSESIAPVQEIAVKSAGSSVQISMAGSPNTLQQ